MEAYNNRVFKSIQQDGIVHYEVPFRTCLSIVMGSDYCRRFLSFSDIPPIFCSILELIFVIKFIFRFLAIVAFSVDFHL